MEALCIGDLTLNKLREIWLGHLPFSISPEQYLLIDKSAKFVREKANEDRFIYGVNTGFGRFSETKIDKASLSALQRNLILSHNTGVGPLMDDRTVRLMMILKINAIAQGYSGITTDTVETLLKLYNHEIYPMVPTKGSVGASGDLAPLGHLVAPLIGEGSCRHHGKVITSVEALEIIETSIVDLQPKEGLALLNGTQASTAMALEGLFYAENVFLGGTLAGGMSVDGSRGKAEPYDERIQAVRRHTGQISFAKAMRGLLEGSDMQAAGAARVQDPYSLRCQPQVMGSSLKAIEQVACIFADEANAVSDNPLLFPDEDIILCGGNFHAEPVGMAADYLAIALSEIGAISERRIAFLIDKQLSGLPMFLIRDGGINSGLMIAQYTAAALASENKSLAHPATVDSIPTSAGQEDHVSMATFAARRLKEIADNVATIVAIEMICAAQAIDFARPLKTSAVLEEAHAKIRQLVPFIEQDTNLSIYINRLKSWIKIGHFNDMLSPYIDMPSMKT